MGDMNIEIIDESAEFNLGTQIKVIGVGGGGGNAVEHMIARNVQGAEFICANTDAQALSRSSANRKIQLGRTGLGAGSMPERGREAAEAAEAQIREALDGAHMLFITAGMGGGTGTGAAPVIARIAREMKVLTVAVVTKPFEWEGGRRVANADLGLTELEANVDSLIVVLNDKLQDVLGEDVTQAEAFAYANDVLKNAVGGIAEIITTAGEVNMDFADVSTVMREQGKAMMGTARASGPDRARIAAEQAVASPLLDGVDLASARGILVLVTASRDSLKLTETSLAVKTVRAYAAPDVMCIFGTAYDEGMGDDLRVTVVATGLTARHGSSRPNLRNVAPPPLQVLRTGTDNMPVGGSAGMAAPAFGSPLNTIAAPLNPQPMMQSPAAVPVVAHAVPTMTPAPSAPPVSMPVMPPNVSVPRLTEALNPPQPFRQPAFSQPQQTASGVRAAAAARVAEREAALKASQGSLPGIPSAGQPNYDSKYDAMAAPAVWRTRDRTQAAAKIDALSAGGMEDLEIPAFLRKQAD
jgi:cell division protein FtsZ